jgi:hypothetical protein
MHNASSAGRHPTTSVSTSSSGGITPLGWHTPLQWKRTCGCAASRCNLGRNCDVGSPGRRNRESCSATSTCRQLGSVSTRRPIACAALTHVALPPTRMPRFTMTGSSGATKWPIRARSMCPDATEAAIARASKPAARSSLVRHVPPCSRTTPSADFTHSESGARNLACAGAPGSVDTPPLVRAVEDNCRSPPVTGFGVSSRHAQPPFRHPACFENPRIP